MSVGHSRQLSCLKKFRSLKDTAGVCRKGIIIQVRQIPSGLPVIYQSLLRIKWSVTDASFNAPRQSNSTYEHTVRWSIYETR